MRSCALLGSWAVPSVECVRAGLRHLKRRKTRLSVARLPPRSVQVRTDWACDYEQDMAATFKANNQHSHVRGNAC